MRVLQCTEGFEAWDYVVMTITVFITTVYHSMPKGKCLVPDIIICGGSCGCQTHAVNCQSSVESMSPSITVCDFGKKAISSTTFTKTKILPRGIYVNWLYKQPPGFMISIISQLWAKIAFDGIITLRSCEQVVSACGLSYLEVHKNIYRILGGLHTMQCWNGNQHPNWAEF